MNRCLVVIPTYNCRSEILEVLKGIHSSKKNEYTNYLIIDNLSMDGTFEAARKFISEKNLTKVHAFQSRQNNSLGGTHKTGFNLAINDSFDYIAIFHGDNQGSIADLEKMINLSVLEKEKTSYLGARFSKESKLIGYSKKRTLGNLVLNLIYSIVSKRRLIDLGSGLNLYNVEDLKKIDFMNFEDSLTFNYELILEMIRRKVPFKYVPIEWREEGQVSNAKNLRIFLKAIQILVNWKIGRKNKSSSQNKVYEIDRNQHG